MWDRRCPNADGEGDAIGHAARIGEPLIQSIVIPDDPGIAYSYIARPRSAICFQVIARSLLIKTLRAKVAMATCFPSFGCCAM
jgi:hypothetical protein